MIDDIEAQRIYLAGYDAPAMGNGEEWMAAAHLNGLRAVRVAALEEAAQIAEKWTRMGDSRDEDRHQMAREIAAAIRVEGGVVAE